MASNDLLVGLEIGTSKICVVVGEARPDGTIKLLGVGQAQQRCTAEQYRTMSHGPPASGDK